MIYIVSKYSVSGTSVIKWPFKKDLGTTQYPLSL